ncbi:heptaprenyl diphosphate synthase component 1 [Robertmurraya massiliosenegalensis]|uniref:heptaprenyl diphosphate synthase component 1 n=1 Tax=Robertmurraya TaxID=2837507 RepID=UPI0039A59709
MLNLQQKLEYVREKIEGKIHHPFLAQNIEAPVIDEDKLFFLVSFLDDLNVSIEDIEHYVVPTMLLQIALDTHDLVTNDLSGDANLKNRQLTVLAGVYYSGLYYKILAEKDNIEVIRLLAEGIETINDQKIIVYQQELDGIEKLMECLKNIEASLHKKLVKHLHANGWDEIISNFLLIKRLSKERDLFVKSQTSVVFDGIKKLVFPRHEQTLKELSNEQKNHLVFICDKYISFYKEMLVKAKNKLPLVNEAVESRIEKVLKQHQIVVKSLVEEG